jgi:hypothetical protein
MIMHIFYIRSLHTFTGQVGTGHSWLDLVSAGAIELTCNLVVIFASAVDKY